MFMNIVPQKKSKERNSLTRRKRRKREIKKQQLSLPVRDAKEISGMSMRNGKNSKLVCFSSSHSFVSADLTTAFWLMS